MKKLLIIGGGAILLLACVAFGAFFAGPMLAQASSTPTNTAAAPTAATNTYCTQYIQDLAKRLNVSATTLQNDSLAAREDILNQMVKDGKLTQSQANTLKQRLEARQACSGKGAAQPYKNFVNAQFVKKYLPDIENQVAQGLHLNSSQLTSQLQSGKSLSQIATAQKVTVAQLKTIVMNALKNDLQKAVSAGDLTQQQANAYTTFVQKHPQLVDRLLMAHLGKHAKHATK